MSYHEIEGGDDEDNDAGAHHEGAQVETDLLDQSVEDGGGHHRHADEQEPETEFLYCVLCVCLLSLTAPRRGNRTRRGNVTSSVARIRALAAFRRNGLPWVLTSRPRKYHTAEDSTPAQHTKGDQH